MPSEACSDGMRPLQKALPSTSETQTQVFGCFRPKYLLILPEYPLIPPGYPIIRHPGRLLGGSGRTYPVGGFQQVQTHRLQVALRTHFEQPEIGCPRIAEFTVAA
ncbi:transposase [Neisseria gonorrhoeae]|uniref:Transposase n=1 Tax=Neisseria gonorrhoeae TaxID=485 RepID=A0A378W096_NEIGO|nr:transposase [Neisseria gonorrhoeae]